MSICFGTFVSDSSGFKDATKSPNGNCWLRDMVKHVRVGNTPRRPFFRMVFSSVSIFASTHESMQVCVLDLWAWSTVTSVQKLILLKHDIYLVDHLAIYCKFQHSTDIQLQWEWCTGSTISKQNASYCSTSIYRFQFNNVSMSRSNWLISCNLIPIITA